jgi:hypothetical protein
MKRSPKILKMVGTAAILIGSLDPMEGSLLILPGSGLVALGHYLERTSPKVTKDWLVIFALNAIGVGALWGFSAVGGFGGDTGRSMWCGLWIMPYLFGWIMALVRIIGPGFGMLKSKWRQLRQRRVHAGAK